MNDFFQDTGGTVRIDGPIHVEARGAPYCGASPQGALVVDEPIHATCVVCLHKVGALLALKEALQ